MTTAYWFDLDHTLVTYERSFESMLEDSLESDQPTAVHETFRQAMFTALESFEAAPYEWGFEHLAAEHELDIEPHSCATRFREIELEATTPVPGATDVLAAVSDHHPLGILTNGDGEMQRAKLQHHGLDGHTEAVIISNEEGIRKPDRAIFDLARDRLEADQHVYVGDTYEEDIVPARDAGFTAIHVRNDDGPALSIDRLASLGAFLAPSGDTH